jgi:DNA-binding transcriptional regulator YiaG
MKKMKIEKNYIETSYGFHVLLHNVQMVEKRGEWVAKINYTQLTSAVLKSLALKSSFLTGNEIHFIRLHFEMTLESFGKRFGVTHQAVMKWENTKDQPTKMNWFTEKDIRLFIYKQLSEKGFSKVYDKLEQIPATFAKNTTEINMEQLEEISV